METGDFEKGEDATVAAQVQLVTWCADQLARNHGATRVRIVDGHNNDARADQEHDGPDHLGTTGHRHRVEPGVEKGLSHFGAFCLNRP